MDKTKTTHPDLTPEIRAVVEQLASEAGGLTTTNDLTVSGALTATSLSGTLLWSDIDFTTSDIADITTKSHTSLTDIGTNTHAQIDTFIGYFPSGIIMMYGGAAAPTGWVLCDGASLLRAGTYASLFAVIGTTFGSVDGTHFNVPDMRGIFARGAGTHGSLLNANGAAFAGTLGAYSNDQIQGHKHRIEVPSAGGGGIRLTQVIASAFTTTFLDSSSKAATLETDGANGPPRPGTETNPANLSLTYIIKV